MIVEIAAILVAVIFGVLVGYLVPVLIQLRKTVVESQQLIAQMNKDLPILVSELRAVSENVRGLTDQARGGVEHATMLLHAVGEVGESVHQVHSLVRGSSGSLLANVASMVAGVRAATHVVRDRLREGGNHDGR